MVSSMGVGSKDRCVATTRAVLNCSALAAVEIPSQRRRTVRARTRRRRRASGGRRRQARTPRRIAEASRRHSRGTCDERLPWRASRGRCESGRVAAKRVVAGRRARWVRSRSSEPPRRRAPFDGGRTRQASPPRRRAAGIRAHGVVPRRNRPAKSVADELVVAGVVKVAEPPGSASIACDGDRRLDVFGVIGRARGVGQVERVDFHDGGRRRASCSSR